MKSILEALTNANAQIAGLRTTLEKARDVLVAQVEQFPDLADALNPQIADLNAKIEALDAPLDPAGLSALAFAVLSELKQVGTLQFTPTPHAGSGI